MKKIIIAVLSLTLLLSSITVTNASTTLTTEQKEILFELGYPSNYASYIDSWYNDWIDSGVDYGEYGGFSLFDSFCVFVSNMSYEDNPDDLHAFSIVARGVFDEVSNEYPYREESMEGIFDCLTNRVTNYSSTWSTYLEAAQKWGLNSINPNMSEYWVSNNVKKPIESASYSSDARDVLIKIYQISWDKHQLGWNPVSDPHFTFTSLPSNYTYFDKSNTSGSIKIGAFYFHPN